MAASWNMMRPLMTRFDVCDRSDVRRRFPPSSPTRAIIQDILLRYAPSLIALLPQIETLTVGYLAYVSSDIDPPRRRNEVDERLILALYIM